MANYAIIENGIVVNTCVADTISTVEEAYQGKMCVEYTDSNPAVIGLGYANGIFEQPPTKENITAEEIEQLIQAGIIYLQ